MFQCLLHQKQNGPDLGHFKNLVSFFYSSKKNIIKVLFSWLILPMLYSSNIKVQVNTSEVNSNSGDDVGESDSIAV